MISKIKNIASVITSVTVIVGIMWGAFRFLDKDSTQGEMLRDIKLQQEVILDSVSVLSQMMQEFDGQLKAVSENTILIGNYVEGVKRAVDYHLQRSPEVTKEDYAKMMLIIEELKKNEKPINIPLSGSTK